MKGMIVKSNVGGEQDYLEVAIPDSLVNVMVNITQHDGPSWIVGGLKMPEEIHLKWNGGNLTVGDEIEIEIADIDKPTPHVYEESHSSFKEHLIAAVEDKDDSVLWKQKLDRYHRLKAILEEDI